MKKRLSIAGILMAALCYSPSVALSQDEANHSCATGQDLKPIKQIEMYLDGFHTYKKEEHLTGEKQRQIRTAHYCKQISPDMFQCLLYDGNSPNAKVIGIEYVITDKLFKTLPKTEQKYWHSHDSEVDTGLLTLPGLPKEKQTEILTSLHSTHGKTWQVWPDLSEAVPLGEPILMWNVAPSKISSTTRRSLSSRQVDPTF